MPAVFMGAPLVYMFIFYNGGVAAAIAESVYHLPQPYASQKMRLLCSGMAQAAGVKFGRIHAADRECPYPAGAGIIPLFATVFSCTKRDETTAGQVLLLTDQQSWHPYAGWFCAFERIASVRVWCKIAVPWTACVFASFGAVFRQAASRAVKGVNSCCMGIMMRRCILYFQSPPAGVAARLPGRGQAGGAVRHGITEA